MTRRRVAVAGVASVVVLALVLARGRQATPATAAPAGAPPLAAITAAAPATPAAAAGHDVAGAIAAALSWEQQVPQLVVGTDDELIAAQSAIAADATRTQLVDANVARLHQLRAQLPAAGAVYRVAVLATTAAAHDSDAVQVVLWRVGVLDIAGRGAAADWATVTDELVWEHAGWHLLTEASEPGPIPAGTTATPAAETAARLSAFSLTGAP